MIKRDGETRRGFVAAIATAAALSTAGCTGGDDEDEEKAADELDEAASLIEENAEALETFSEETDSQSEDDPPTFHNTSFQMNVELARRHVETAREAAPSAYEAERAYYHSVLDFQAEAGDYNSLLTEYFLCLETMLDYIDKDRWDDAAAHHGECVETLEGADEQMGNVRDAYGDIDTSEVDESTRQDYETLGEHLGVRQDELAVMFDFHDGMQYFLEGMTEVQAGLEALESDDLPAAKRAFSRSEGEFRRGEAAFERLESDPDLPPELESDVLDLHCSLEGLHDAAGHFYNAIEAEQDGDAQRREEELQRAEAALTRCD